MIVGIDEVGRGPWAGPLVVGAVVLGDAKIEGLTDSKKLSAKRRLELSIEIHEKAAAVGLGWVHADELDEIGISASLVEATKRALEKVTVPYHEIIIDGTVNFLKDTGKGPYVTTLKKADLLIGAVSAASIVAKVARDRFMEEQAKVYPQYGFETHVGYGTARHSAAIGAHGITPLHRLSFAPLHKYRPKHMGEVNNTVTAKQLGDKAEEIVVTFLQDNGHTVLERNWKTKFCEIDIVSQSKDTIYFTEVKYRKNTGQGGGIAAITSKKMKQMKFSAEYFALKNKMQYANMRLAVADVAGQDFLLDQWFEIE